MNLARPDRRVEEPPCRGLVFAGVATLLSFFLLEPVLANPSGGRVRHGDIRLREAGNTLRVIQNSRRGVIDWNSFSIQHGQTTRFIQPGARSATLNRVTGGAVSRIDGNLRADGQIFVLNPNGVVIGRNAVIDVAGFTASTLDLSDENFLAGGDLSFEGTSQAAVLNLGTVSAFDGDIFLIAASVENSGRLRAPRGTVGLAAGNDVLVKESGTERVFVRGVSGGTKANGVLNQGTVEANVAELKSYGGNIYGMAVKNEGRVAATAVTREGGQIFLRAGGPGSSGGRIRSTGKLVARKPAAPTGGNVVVDAGPEGDVEIGGDIDASQPGGTGGTILVLGRSIDVLEGSVFLADGDTAGGSIRIGGGLRGGDPDLFNATDVTIGNGAVLDASANVDGDGGEIIVFAERALDFQGSLRVRGGELGGDGGFAELSGKETVRLPTLVGSVDLGAPAGEAGTLLIDPNDIAILAGSSTTIPSNPGGDGFTPVRDNILYAGDVSLFLDTIGNLRIETDVSDNTNMYATGVITLRSGAGITWNSANDLEILAYDRFVMEESTGISSQAGNIHLYGGNGVEIRSGTPVILLEKSGPAPMTISPTYVTSDSGDIRIENGNSAGSVGISIEGDISSNSGAIEIVGHSSDGYSRGLKIGDSSISTTSGNIFLKGVDTGFEGPGGVYLDGTFVGSQSGDIRVEGMSEYGDGVSIYGGEIVTQSGDIQVEGRTLGLSSMYSALPPGGAGYLIGPMGIRLYQDSATTPLIHATGGGSVPPTISLVGENRGPVGEAIESDFGGTLSPAPILMGETVRVKSDGGDVRLSDVHGGHFEFALENGKSGDFWLDESHIDSFTAPHADSIHLRDHDSLHVGDIFANGHVAIFLDGGPLTIGGQVHSAQSVALNAEQGFQAFQLFNPIHAPDLYLNGAGSGAFVETRGVFRLEGVHFNNIIDVRGVGQGNNVLVGTSGDELIEIKTHYDLGGIPILPPVPPVYGPKEAGNLAIADPVSVIPIRTPVAEIGSELFFGYNIISGGRGNDTFLVKLDRETPYAGRLHGGRGNDNFAIQPGGSVGQVDGGRGVDRLDYSAFQTPIVADFEKGRATQVRSIRNMERIAGGAARDTLIGTSKADEFRILSENAGMLNRGIFSGFERLVGGGGPDRFLFQNQATVESVFGGKGFDLLQVDDRGLGGQNTYLVGKDKIVRNPTYHFKGMEAVQLLLGGGNDTVRTRGNGLVQLFNGGPGKDFLDMGKGVYLGPNPIRVGNSQVFAKNFEGPRSPNSDDGPGAEDSGTVLSNQSPGIPKPQGNGNGNNGGQNNYSGGGNGAGNLMGGNPGGNAFSAVAAVANQAAVVGLDGGGGALGVPASLDGTFAIPPQVVIDFLKRNLEPEAWTELAEAIGYDGPIILVMEDGAFAIDLSGVPPDDVLALLAENLLMGAASELFGALEMTLVLPITSIDGAVAIVAIPVVVDPEIVALLEDLLSDDALSELTGALNGE